MFDLPDHLAPKADPALIAQDERHFAAMAQSLAQLTAELSDRLDAARRAPGGKGRQAVDRDEEVRRLTARLCEVAISAGSTPKLPRLRMP
ncbi:hypothetical protein AB0283_18620, partial [Micromonospora vinacea]